MRHDRCAKDADRYVKHRGVRENLRCWHKAANDSTGIGACGPQFVGEAGADGEDERGDQCFDDAEAAALQNEDEHHVERSDDDAPHEWNVKEQLQRDGGADDFGKVASDDGQFTKEPQGERDWTRVMIAARLCQITASNNSEAHGEVLQQHRHEVRCQDHKEERVAPTGAGRQTRGPVARIHIADRDHHADAAEGPKLAPQGGTARSHRDG